MNLFKPKTLAQIRVEELTHAQLSLQKHTSLLEYHQAIVLMLIKQVDRLNEEVTIDQKTAKAPLIDAQAAQDRAHVLAETEARRRRMVDAAIEAAEHSGAIAI